MAYYVYVEEGNLQHYRGEEFRGPYKGYLVQRSFYRCDQSSNNFGRMQKSSVHRSPCPPFACALRLLVEVEVLFGCHPCVPRILLAGPALGH